MRARIFGNVIDIKLPQGPVKQVVIFVTVFFMITTFYMLNKVNKSNGEKLKYDQIDPDLAEFAQKGFRSRNQLGNTEGDILGPLGQLSGLFETKPKQNARRIKMAMDVLNVQQKQRLKKEWMNIYENQIRPSDQEFNINVTLSDKISFNRKLPDSRPPVCLNKTYDYSTLPTVSVIIPFNNEALSMLLRAVHSILNRTPDSLLKEIILVDDDSSNVNLHDPLENYVNLLPKVRLLRTKKRVGLIKARMLGAEQAEGKMLVFQDAHTENNEGWVEPLGEEILRHPNAVLQPSVDGVDKDTIEYVFGHSIHVGAFSWSLT